MSVNVKRDSACNRVQIFVKILTNAPINEPVRRIFHATIQKEALHANARQAFNFQTLKVRTALTSMNVPLQVVVIRMPHALIRTVVSCAIVKKASMETVEVAFQVVALTPTAQRTRSVFHLQRPTASVKKVFFKNTPTCPIVLMFTNVKKSPVMETQSVQIVPVVSPALVNLAIRETDFHVLTSTNVIMVLTAVMKTRTVLI